LSETLNQDRLTTFFIPLAYMFVYINLYSLTPVRMKPALKIILASIVSTFAFIGAMGASNPWPAYVGWIRIMDSSNMVSDAF